ncbi:hypothetical protein [Parapedobacter sp. 10938]|uniref:hypothetical protein n=1 Tax=Parapedobacter flavus TaxID=3110225 RepID=UPI002DB8F918|nr:hypothetical protein [Parapedobacter sp. 10938]MEC3878445.1 hypothetical protein [Parapedobacter sp. 10938]
MRFSFLFFLSFFTTAKAQPSDGLSAEEVVIVFEIAQNESIYVQSAFGEPPQIGIWLENPNTGEVRTVFVTEKTGRGSYEGKAGVPVALPAWIAAYRSETGRTDFPTLRKPVVDAITGPTSKQSLIEKRVAVEAGANWNYYIEVNVAGDYNHTYPQFHDNGSADFDGNGQPSLIYGGKITANPGAHSQPELLGVTEQLFFSPVIKTDMSGIDTAKEIFSSITVSCLTTNP